MEVINNDNKEKNKIAGTVFVGCMFLGMGIGFFIGKLVAGMFIGMGVGFLASAGYKAIGK